MAEEDFATLYGDRAVVRKIDELSFHNLGEYICLRDVSQTLNFAHGLSAAVNMDFVAIHGDLDDLMVALVVVSFALGVFVIPIVHRFLSLGGVYADTGLNAREAVGFCHGKKLKLGGI